MRAFSILCLSRSYSAYRLAQRGQRVEGRRKPAIIRISGNFWTRVSPTSGRGSRQQLWSGRSRSPADRAERADQGVIGGEPVPRRLAGSHDVRQAGKYRVGEPVAAQIVPNPLDWIELRAVGRQR